MAPGSVIQAATRNRHMSFRGRLTVFFVAIVVVPMIAVAVLVVQVTDDSRDGKADARLAGGLQTARVLYDDALERSSDAIDLLAENPGLGPALSAPNRDFLKRLARELEAEPGLVTARFFDAEGGVLATEGPRDAIARTRRPVQLPGGQRVGEVEVAALRPGAFAREVAELTGTGAVITSATGELAATVETGGADLPDGSGGATVELPEGSFRVAGLELDGAPAGTRLLLATAAAEGFVASEPLVAGVLLAFFALASLFVLLLLRLLQRQIAAMLDAARRIGTGDFSHKVPAEGNDEMAGLAREFNKMSDQLSQQMEELRRQRTELDQSVRRIGEAFASGLDRKALLEIVIETGLAACEAESGRIVLAASDGVEAEAGVPADDGLAEVLAEAAERALASGEAAEAERGDRRAIAHPLTDPGERDPIRGAMAVARTGPAFTAAQREVLRYLIGQAAVSVENIGLHERVAEQAVTDELTGLSNNRHFRDWMEREVERLGRFGGELSLVLLDIDDFKRVNDVHGHLQGDAVLAEIGRILRLESRGVDEPARYGGEEFVLALPETPKEGAVEVAERVRERIEKTEVRGVEGNDALRVTASLGVATMPADGDGTQALIGAADAALYEAKRSGKNRVQAANGRLG